jgi:predicted negative regulator of RcsB-dependent stress response
LLTLARLEQSLAVTRVVAVAVALALSGTAAPAETRASPEAAAAQTAARSSTPIQRLGAVARARRLLEAGATDEAEPLLTTLLQDAEAAGDQATAVLAEAGLGRVQGLEGDAEAAARWFETAERRARRR